MLVSGSEHSPFIRALGRPSNRPEEFGCDIMAAAGGRWTGFQRKEIRDLVASLHDGRINIERAQWNRLLDRGGRVVLVIEGRLEWTRGVERTAHVSKVGEEVLAGIRGKPWPRRDFERFVYSVGKQGVVVAYTDNERHTAELVQNLVDYENRERTGSRIPARPNPKGRWGTASSREWLVHVATSLGPGIGAGKAEALLDAFGGRLPIRWECEYEDLLAIPGWGRKTADAAWRALNPLQAVEDKGA